MEYLEYGDPDIVAEKFLDKCTVKLRTVYPGIAKRNDNIKAIFSTLTFVFLPLCPIALYIAVKYHLKLTANLTSVGFKPNADGYIDREKAFTTIKYKERELWE